LFLPTLLPTLDNYTQLGIYSRSHSNLPLGRLRLPEDIPGPLAVIYEEHPIKYKRFKSNR
ncbi:hypothetical protein, partial [Zobellia barbeyronii]|uniref:hypothetical protein n=1 Tax=Zobellia barbeyronii TaxID=2748009 RepID=UPI001BE0976C